MTKQARIWGGVGVSLVCLWLALRTVPFEALGSILLGADYVWLLPAAALQMVAVVARAQRWVVLLGPPATLIESFWALARSRCRQVG
jgi:uncharacterized membrane protein YbhN (UPF0104 family)